MWNPELAQDADFRARFMLLMTLVRPTTLVRLTAGGLPGTLMGQAVSRASADPDRERLRKRSGEQQHTCTQRLALSSLASELSSARRAGPVPVLGA